MLFYIGSHINPKPHISASLPLEFLTTPREAVPPTLGTTELG